MGVQNILDAQGIGLAVTGMGIVFTVLLLVSLFITWLPHVLPIVNSILPIVEHHHGAPMPSAAAKSPADLEHEVVAAIGLALHQRQREK